MPKCPSTARMTARRRTSKSRLVRNMLEEVVRFMLSSTARESFHATDVPLSLEFYSSFLKMQTPVFEGRIEDSGFGRLIDGFPFGAGALYPREACGRLLLREKRGAQVSLAGIRKNDDDELALVLFAPGDLKRGPCGGTG